MRKLQNKTFLVLFIILTSFLLCLLVIFNYGSYQREYSDISTRLEKIKNNKNSFLFNNTPENKLLLIDSIIYSVFFDNNYNVTNIVSYNSTGLSNEEIIKLANIYMLNSKHEQYWIRNLYFNQYAYVLASSRNLIILDLSIFQIRLIAALRLSIGIFIILECLVLYLSLKLTKWLVKPVDETFQKQKQFIYDASHELKTPLAVIIASADNLENNFDEKKWLNNIKSEADRMNKLVTNLLELAKAENDLEKSNYSEVDLSKITEMTALTFESLFYERDLKFDYQITDNIKIIGSSDKIQELIGILLDNAIKHSYSKSKINLTLSKEKDQIILLVKNRGKEIPESEREKIFERFYRSDESRNRGDNRYGLGLAIAKNIVEVHKGKITVQCADSYTTFKVIFKK